VRLLLDTHAYLWALSNTPRLGPRTRGLIADRDNDVFVSVVSLWEIVLKAAKLRADIPTVLQSVEPSGFASLPLGASHLQRLFELGGLFDDPFDRLLVAQADCERLTLVTEDANILDRRFVDAIECRTGRLLRAKGQTR
jgi:PIN domain nuclease of toxin-antitoxin system